MFLQCWRSNVLSWTCSASPWLQPFSFYFCCWRIDTFFSGNHVSTMKHLVFLCLNLWENLWKLGRKLVGINNIWHTIFLFITMLWRFYEIKYIFSTLESLPGIQEVLKNIRSHALLFPVNSYCTKACRVITWKSHHCHPWQLYMAEKKSPKDNRERVNRPPCLYGGIENSCHCWCKHPNPTWPLQSQPYPPSDMQGLGWACCSRW